MHKIALLLALSIGLAACSTTTVHEETDLAPTAGLKMGPPNESAPASPIDHVTNPSRQIPTNTPGRY